MDWLLNYLTALVALPMARSLPTRYLDRLAFAIGRSAYIFVPRRRRAALENLRRFYRGDKAEPELKDLARRSSACLALSAMENLRAPGFDDGPGGARFFAMGADSQAALRRARALHEQAGGCVFVSAHLGAYTLLPQLFAEARIALTVPINGLRNRALQDRWCPLDRERHPGAEIFVTKKNSLAALLRALDVHRSVGLLADQRASPAHALTGQASAVLTTRLPALLALERARPVVVVACYRNPSGAHLRIELGEALWPVATADKEKEVARLCLEIDQSLARLVRAAPEQYLWMHNRWKPHRSRARGGSPSGRGLA
jgi:KDO2-lipid IV(A) lauroyltransferase